MIQIDNRILIGIIFVLIFYIYQNKTIERMSNEESMDKKIEEAINKKYLADLGAIRNLSEVSKKLQSDGLTIPGNLRVEGNLVVDRDSNVKGNLNVDKDSSVKGTSTIHTLDGGKYTGGGGWRDIELKDKNRGFRFIVGDKKFGFHPNGNGLHYQHSNNSYNKMPMYGGANVKGNLNAGDINANKVVSKRSITNGNVNINGMLYGKNFQFCTSNDCYSWIKSHPNTGQLVLHGGRGCRGSSPKYLGVGAYDGNCGVINRGSVRTW